MRLTCPYCGTRDLREFTIMGSQAQLDLPHDDLDRLEAQLYLRDNRAGESHELWYHEGGCRQWLRVTRNTVSHAISAVQALAEGGAA